MSALSERLALRERMLYEENVRLNRTHETLLRVASDGWEQFKAAFRDECEATSSQAQLTRLECDEPDECSFQINRVRPYTPPVCAIVFRFDPAIPRITWQDLQNKKLAKPIEMALDGSSVCFLQDGRPLILSRFVENCLEAICL